MRLNLLIGLVLLTIGTVVASEPTQRTLTFEDRVAAQRAIEQVYWNHRIWPTDNPTPKPQMSSVLTDDVIRAKVEDSLKKLAALEKFWRRPITGEQLQAEMDRMARDSRDGEALLELFHALGDDPLVIAETLAGPSLADRLIRNWYSNDSRFHGEVKSRAMAALSTCESVDCMKSMGGAYREVTVRRALHNFPDPVVRPGDDNLVLDTLEWRKYRQKLAEQVGDAATQLPLRKLSRLAEVEAAFSVSAVLRDTGDEITVATVEWPKPSFDSWWQAQRRSLDTIIPSGAGAFELPHISTVGCVNDTWKPTFADVPDARSYHTAVWTGAEMIVWGGESGNDLWDAWPLNSGGRYDPATDTWSSTSTVGAVPDERGFHTAVWTGTEMIVFGGRVGRNMPDPDGNGGRYDPTTDTWRAMSSNPAVGGAWPRIALWTGTDVIVWSGGQRYNPSSDSWTTISAGPIDGGTAVWTGSEMIVWGGYNYATGAVDNAGARYNPTTDSWTATSTGSNVPPANGDEVAVWTRAEMIVWSIGHQTGGRYDPSTDSWQAVSAGAGAPSPRGRTTVVWTGTEMIIWGGYDWNTGSYLNSGARYRPAGDSWVQTSVGPNAPSQRAGHSAIWTGSEMIVWGGTSYSGVYNGPNTGARYSPQTDSWIPTATHGVVPIARSSHTAIWTGSEMLVWMRPVFRGNSNGVTTRRA